MFDYIKKHKPKIVFGVDTVLSTLHQGRAQGDFEKYYFAKRLRNQALLVAFAGNNGQECRYSDAGHRR